MGEDVSELRCGSAGEKRQRRRLELAHQRQQGVGEKRVGHAGLHRVRAANRDAPPFLRGTLGRGSSKSGLPYPPFPDDED